MPLQPELRPTPPWLLRLLVLGTLVVAMLALGAISQRWRRPPELVLSDGAPYQAARVLERRFAAAQERIWVSMFVVRIDGDPDQAPPDDPIALLLRSLVAAHDRGVDVRVCLDLGRDRETGEIEDKHRAAQDWLTARGVRVTLDEDGRTTHAKVVLIDRRWVVIGSHNWTRSAMTRNREVSVVLDDPTMAATLERELFARIPGWN